MTSFLEVAETVSAGLNALGHDATISSDIGNPLGRQLLFRPHADPMPPIRKDAVLYNMEQLHDRSPHVNERFLKRLSAFEVWDYSQRNVDWLRKKGIVAKHLPVSYSPMLERVNRKPPRHDVLFYGNMSPRRQYIIDRLRQRGAQVTVIDGASAKWGSERDDLIGASKIVLNVHYYDFIKLLETARISYLLANQSFVVSEASDDAGEDTSFQDGVVFAPYDRLDSVCMEWLHVEERQRQGIAANGRDLMRRRPIESALATVLGNSALVVGSSPRGM